MPEKLQLRAYAELAKPRITLFILVSTAVGYYFGVPGNPARPLFTAAEWWNFCNAILGTGLLASGTAALNQWYERGSDAKMRRTAMRPIPSGRLSADRALVFGLAISLAGFAELLFTVNLLSALLGLMTLATYLLIYTPLKRKSWLCTAVGAIPGAMPPLIGFAAARGALPEQSWALFLILFFWQFPHFYAIAWLYKEDYSLAAIKMLPVLEPHCRSTARQMVLFGSLLVPISLAPWLLAMAGSIYAAGAALLGLWFLHFGIRAAMKRTTVHARAVMRASIVYLPVLYGLLILDRA